MMDIAAWLDGFVRDPGFLRRYPYYAAILAKLAPVADPSVQRMAVSLHEGRFYLHVNVDSFLAEPQYLRGVLLHEVHHVALGHLSHPKFAEAAEPELMDVAIEMSANEYIEEPLPNPITWAPYASLGLRAGQSTMDRYDRLVAASLAGKLGSATGAGERQRVTAVQTAPGGAAKQATIPPDRTDDHRFLRRRERAPGAVEQTRQLLQRAVEDARRDHPELFPQDGADPTIAGRTPGRLLEELSGALGPAEQFVDWKTALRMFVARARGPVHSYARPARRFPGRVGEMPGRAWSPRVMDRPSLLAAIDTSMSMTKPELEEIARQLARLGEHARLTVVECDVAVERVYPFTGALPDVRGRGGTDLRPVFDPAFLAGQRPDGIVYFTDGEGPTPEAPPRQPVLWVLTKPQAFACVWGARAYFGRKGGKAR